MKLKKIESGFYFILIVLVSSLALSCGKENESLPQEFEKKPLVEVFKAEWCSSCPAANHQLGEIIDLHGESVLSIGMHFDDKLQLHFPTTTSFMVEFYGLNFMPAMLVNRTIDLDSELIVRLNRKLGEKSETGVKLETFIEENSLNIKVHYLSSADQNNLHLSVYLVEDNVPESSHGAQAAGGGNYIHRNVLREVLTPKMGVPVNLKANKEDAMEFTVSNVKKYKIPDLKVLAFLHMDNSGSYAYINGNSVKAGENADW
jgi:thiol-disulfide isomerase/thioredoxin